MGDELKNLPVVQEVDAAIVKFLSAAGIPDIKTADDVLKAEEIRKAVRMQLALIDAKLDPFREAAYKAYQGWLGLIKAQRGKLEALDAALVKNVRAWKAQEERKAVEERKRREDERLAAAAELEEKGDVEAANAVLEVATKEPEKIESTVKLDMRTFGDKWHAEVVNERAFYRWVLDIAPPDAIELIMPNMPTLNRLAREQKDKLSIPGVEAVKE